MAEIIIGIVVVFGTLFILWKVLGKIAQSCGFSEVMETMGESLAVGRGDFSSNRRD